MPADKGPLLLLPSFAVATVMAEVTVAMGVVIEPLASVGAGSVIMCRSDLPVYVGESAG